MMGDPATTAWYLRPLVEWVRNRGIKACEAKALDVASRTMLQKPFANVGGGSVTRWPNALCVDAKHERDLDFNTCPLPFADGSLGMVICEQVIEHLHNTTFFLSELARILMPGGALLLATENLASLPNLFALVLQRAPFSTQAVCGSFVGGWKDGPAGFQGDGVPPNHPTFSGVRGHVRVLTNGQTRALLEQAGFQVREQHGYGGNHYVLFVAQKTI